MKRFGIDEAAALYGIDGWSNGYFRVNKNGNVDVLPQGPAGASADLHELVKDLTKRKVSFPVILRFPQILEHRVQELHNSFLKSMRDYGYSGDYRGVFPIKVNQRRLVVETLVGAGSRYHYGLEAGSKAELAICLALHRDPEALICCNGFKDTGFIRLALWGRKLGKKVILTVEKLSELQRILDVAREMNVEPMLGIRFRLYSRGSGLWEKSGGDLAKFGLNAAELLEAIQTLKKGRQLHLLTMLHCHIGSQITDIRRVKNAMKEAARIYAKARRHKAPVKYLNVGGGLGVDYDGSKSSFYASMNYTLQEYTNDVVYTVKEICDEENVPHPDIVSESGRAMTAYHSVLVLPVLDASGPLLFDGKAVLAGPKDPAVIRELSYIHENINIKTFREFYHDAQAHKEELYTLFNLGYLGLEERAKGEMLFFRICQKVIRLSRQVKEVPDDLQDLESRLADKYICNFSLFQSLPDHWAVDALFPMMPLQRLHERPARRATVADITCDSDGMIDKFVDLKDVKESLPVHELRSGEAYHVGVFLTGAYQDVLGDTHNLFGKLNEAHVVVDDAGETHFAGITYGQTVAAVASTMDYYEADLINAIGAQVAEASKEGAISEEEGDGLVGEYQAAMTGTTYLE